MVPPARALPVAQTSGTGCQPLCGPLLASRRQRPRGERDCSEGSARASLGWPPRLPGLPPRAFPRALLPQVCSGHLPAVHSRSCPGVALQTQAPAPGRRRALQRTRVLSRYVVLWAGRSEDCRGWAAALSRSLGLPAVPNSRPDGDWTPASAPQPLLLSRVQVWSCSVSSFSLPGFARICTFLSGARTPASFQLVPCEILRIRGCVPDASLRGAALQPTHPDPSCLPGFVSYCKLNYHDGIVVWRKFSKFSCRGILPLRQPDLSCHHTQASLIAQLVKNLPSVQKTRVQYLGREDPLEKEMATHCTILAWKIP